MDAETNIHFADDFHVCQSLWTLISLFIYIYISIKSSPTHSSLTFFLFTIFAFLSCYENCNYNRFSVLESIRALVSNWYLKWDYSKSFYLEINQLQRIVFLFFFGFCCVWVYDVCVLLLLESRTWCDRNFETMIHDCWETETHERTLTIL